MTKMSKLRATRIIRMCLNYSEYDRSVVTSPVLDDAGFRRWRVFYSEDDQYMVLERNGVWRISRVDALVICSDRLPEREEISLL